MESTRVGEKFRLASIVVVRRCANDGDGDPKRTGQGVGGCGFLVGIEREAHRTARDVDVAFSDRFVISVEHVDQMLF